MSTYTKQELNNPHRSRGHWTLAWQLCKAIALCVRLRKRSSILLYYGVEGEFIHPQSFAITAHKYKNNWKKIYL